MNEYIIKQKVTDRMRCCLANAKAEYKAAKDKFTKARFGDYISAIQAMIDVVGCVEAADVQPIKHGQWFHINNDGIVYCSECNNEAYWDTDYGQQLFDYCPYCGAKMIKDGDING